MGDLIDRQDAIEALGEEPPVWYDGDDEIAERNQWRRDKAAIEAVPPACNESKQQATDSSDCISRQDAIDVLDDEAELLRRVSNDTDIVGAERIKYRWGLGLLESCISDMKELPSAESERKKGKWIDSKDVSWMCSECGKWLDVLQGDVKMNFCPNCGSYNGG